MHTLAFLDAVRDPAGTFLHLLVSALAHFVDGARSEIERALTRYLFTTVDTSSAGQRAFTGNPSLRRMNLGMAVAMDILLGAVVLFTCLRSMFERSFRARYTLKVALPRVLLALVLVHFSLPLMQMGIDLNNALSNAALTLGADLRVDGLPWSAAMGPEAVQRLGVSQDLFHAVFAVATVVAVVILILAYVIRYALLGVLVVMAPVAGLCTVLPETRNYARSWLRLFMVTVFMQFVQLTVLRVASVMSIDNGGGLVQTLYGLATLFLLLKVPGALNTASHLETKAKTMGHHLERAVIKAVHPTHRRVSRSAA